ncbi:hypothetical protein N7454_006028 [Penicillium verhagenii]|nr:hypothetical protein N7454_006028 [Penicillium verhagenii]
MSLIEPRWSSPKELCYWRTTYFGTSPIKPRIRPATPQQIVSAKLPGNPWTNWDVGSSTPGVWANPCASNRYLLLAAIGVPAAFYLSRRGSRHHLEPIATFDERHGIDTHFTEEVPARERTLHMMRCVIDAALWTGSPSLGAPKGPHTISFKQEGLSNTDALNPYMNATGKSQKGEGEIETAKIKGTVSPNRPQV